MSATQEDVRRIAEAAAEAAVRKVLHEIGIRTDSDDAIEKAQDTWKWATRQRRMQAELGKNVRTAAVWTLVAAGLTALGYGAIHLLSQASDGAQHVKEAGATVLRSLSNGRFT